MVAWVDVGRRLRSQQVKVPVNGPLPVYCGPRARGPLKLPPFRLAVNVSGYPGQRCTVSRRRSSRELPGSSSASWAGEEIEEWSPWSPDWRWGSQ